MTDNELLLSISDMLDKKLDERITPIKNHLDKIANRLDIIELKQDGTAKKLEDLRLDAAVAERDIRRGIHELKDEMETVIEILKMNDLLPH